ncbi:MAG: hypothetical protein EHM21_09785 [Chloroflexi bacterium]|nr:MAG: hypothetical protein EHM21_09785 [Chloroflexota bacterium]
MLRSTVRYHFVFLGIILLMIGLSGCSQVVTGGNYTLGSGQRVDGSLFILSSNADLLEGSLVTGSVIQLCCNLTVRGQVNDGIFMLAGNVMVETGAQIDNDITLVTGNFTQLPGSQIVGQVSEGLTGGVLLILALAALLSLAVPIALVFAIVFAAFRLLQRKPGPPGLPQGKTS